MGLAAISRDDVFACFMYSSIVLPVHVTQLANILSKQACLVATFPSIGFGLL